MKMKFLSLLPLLSVVLSQNASAFCDTMSTRVYVDMLPGHPTYITTRSRKDFISGAKQKVSPNTLGLTVAQLTVSGQAEPDLNLANQTEEICAGLGTVRFKMGYDTGNLTVFIDKKYQPGSCEYEVIKKHENYHVQVAQQAMRFFKEDIEKQIHKSIASLRPQKVANITEYQEVVQKQFQKVMNDLAPLLQHINNIIAEKNYIIDTPESYEATKRLCKNW